MGFCPREDRTGTRIGYLTPEQLSKFFAMVSATAGDQMVERIKISGYMRNSSGHREETRR